MKRINDIFYSLQGEGYHTGRAAVFIRFAGCNLRCPFCDTDFDDYREMTDAAILEAIQLYPARFVVLTGGEPTLQADEPFIDLLHRHGYYVAMESNGTRSAPANVDWLTVSPKIRGERREERGERLPDELKVIFDEDTDPQTFLVPRTSYLASRNTLFLQPCDTGDAVRNQAIINRCIDYIKEHPEWRLSLQTHKLADFK